MTGHPVKSAILIAITCLLILITRITLGQTIVLEEGEDGPVPRGIILPYAFYAESLDLAMGAAFGTSGNLQPQTKILHNCFCHQQ